MKLFDHTWIAMLILSMILIFPIQTSATSPNVIVSEIGWAGSLVSSSDEWLELTNITSNSINISGFYLTGAGSGGANIVIPDQTVLEPYSSYLISNYDQTHENTTLGAKSDLVTATLSLSNQGFTLYLYDDSGTQIDSAGDGTSPFAGGSGSTQDSDDGRYRSMVRVDGCLDGSLETSWINSVSSVGFIEGATEIGTPGTVDEWLLLPETETIQEIHPVEETVTEEAEDTEFTSYTVGALIITEFVSDPAEGEEEWVEIKNVSGVTVNLSGWTLEDATTRQTLLGEFTLEPNAYLVIQSPSGKLNNDGDHIVMRDGTGSAIDQIEYGTEDIPKPNKGQSVALSETGFQRTDVLTPGSNNVIQIIEIEKQEETATQEEDIQETENANPLTQNATEQTAMENTVSESETPSEETPQEETTSQTSSSTSQVSNALSSSTAEMSETQTNTGPTTIELFKLYPNTTGTDALEEYIVITNTGSEPVDLTGWILQDASGKSYRFTGGHIEAGTSLTLCRIESNIALNNNGDTLLLISPNETLIDSVAYEKAKAGDVLVKANGQWIWESEQEQIQTQTESTTQTTLESTTPLASQTSNQTNTTAQTPVVVASSQTVGKTSTTSSTNTATVQKNTYIGTYSIEAVKQLSDGTEVQVSGIVTVEPTIFGKQILYIQDTSGGIQIYKNDALFPELKRGDQITVTGELSTNRGERRIKISSNAVMTVEQLSEEEPFPINGALAENFVGMLVTVTGLVNTKASNTATIEQDGVETTIYFGSNSNLVNELPARGERVEITGIVTSSNGDLRIRPRNSDDIVVPEQEVQETLLLGSTEKDEFAHTQGTIAWILVMSTVVVLGLLALKKYFPVGRKHAQA